MMQSSTRVSLAATLALAALAMPHAANASGYALKEHGASGLGNAFAGGTAGAEDATTIFTNPATMTRLQGNQVLGVASYILPQSSFRGDGASRATGFGGSAITGNSQPGNAGENILVPALYGVWDLNPSVKLGLAITAPWGLTSDYDPDWTGRYHALRSELKTYNVTPTLAYRVSDTFSIGGGIQIQYVTAQLSNAIDFGTIGQAALGAPARLPLADGRGKVEGDGLGFGGTLGVLWEPRPTTRVGLSFRSAVTHDLRGDGTFENVPAAFANSVNFRNSKASARMVTPEVISAGVYHAITPQWAVMGDVTWTNWSRFKELRIEFDSGRADSVTEEHWKNSWAVAGGVTYRPTDALTLRTGVAWDQSPVPDANRTPRIPDQDRVWLSIGAGYKVSDAITVDAGYAHIFVRNARLNQTDTGAAGDTNRFRGNLSGTFENSVDIVSVQARLRF